MLPNLCAQIAQLVEQRTENPRVAGSIPALGTILMDSVLLRIESFFAIKYNNKNFLKKLFQ